MLTWGRTGNKKEENKPALTSRKQYNPSKQGQKQHHCLESLSVQVKEKTKRDYLYLWHHIFHQKTVKPFSQYLHCKFHILQCNFQILHSIFIIPYIRELRKRLIIYLNH